MPSLHCLELFPNGMEELIQEMNVIGQILAAICKVIITLWWPG